MIDQLYDRNYRAARARLNGDIATGLTRVRRKAAEAFEALVRIQFAAPWIAQTGK